eukprot:TRINITY_DN6661_c0_g1_i4.p1 TRINITY_DN6661_c0_g1~~TRINITY_DN6661_c0_g1_i4.p1  ORF type:complete len:156 (+),score=32.79 TRINITY_DN6661_c0_g1_i4:42-509(+)
MPVPVGPVQPTTWKQAFDKQSGDPYWFDPKTKATRWDQPVGEQDQDGNIVESQDGDSVENRQAQPEPDMNRDSTMFSLADAEQTDYCSEPTMRKPATLNLDYRWCTKTWVSFILLLIFFLPLCWIPCACKRLQEPYVVYPKDYDGPVVDPKALLS